MRVINFAQILRCTIKNETMARIMSAKTNWKPFFFFFLSPSLSSSSCSSVVYIAPFLSWCFVQRYIHMASGISLPYYGPQS